MGQKADQERVKIIGQGLQSKLIMALVRVLGSERFDKFDEILE